MHTHIGESGQTREEHAGDFLAAQKVVRNHVCAALLAFKPQIERLEPAQK